MQDELVRGFWRMEWNSGEGQPSVLDQSNNLVATIEASNRAISLARSG